MKHLSLLLALLTAFGPSLASATALQQQDFKTVAQCTAASAALGNCLLLGSQAWDETNGQQLSKSISTGLFGPGGTVLLNPSFEAGTGSWTASTGTFTAQTTTIFPGAGAQAASWVIASNGATLSQDITPASSLQAVNLEASCWVNTTASNVQLCSRSGGTAGQCATVNPTGTWQYVPIDFVGPSSGSVGVQVSTTSATSATVYIDQCYVGRATNLSQVSQAQWVGSLNFNCSNYWSGSGTSWFNFGANTGTCTTTPSGSLAASGSNPAAVLSNAAAGTYQVIFISDFRKSTSNAGWAGFRISDGTNTSAAFGVGDSSTGQELNGGSSIQGRFTYATSQSSVTWQVQGVTDASGNLARVGQTNTEPTSGTGASGGIGSPTLMMQADVYFFPSQSQTAYQASSGGLNAGEESITAAPACEVGTIPEDGTSYLRTQYPALFAKIGTVYGSVDGTHFTVPDARGVFERGAGTNGSLTASNGGSFTGIQGTAQNDMMQGHFHSASITSETVTINSNAGELGSGSFANDNVSVTVGSPTSDGTNGTPRTGLETRPASISHLHCIRYIGASPAPVIVGGVISQSSGTERVERYTIGASSSCTVLSTSDVGASGATGSTGQCQITFGKAFSAAPACVTSITYTAGNSTFTAVIDAHTAATTAAHVNIAGISTAGAYAAADGFTLTCQGAR